jgi:hypothetical protein
MKKYFWILTFGSFTVAAALGTTGYFAPAGYVQDLLSGTATTFLGLAVALVLVNYYLTASEKAEAAAPLLKLIQPAIVELHNDLFIRLWDARFGIDKRKSLLSKYDSNQRNPKAFSPKECDAIHNVIISKAADLVRVFDLLIDQFRELSMITGWSFDPSVTAAALEARLWFVKFKSLQAATDQESKYQIVEAYLDGEAAATAVFEKLITRLGVPRTAWQK